MQYIDHVSQKCTLETYMILLTNVTPTHLIKNKITKVFANLLNKIWHPVGLILFISLTLTNESLFTD